MRLMLTSGIGMMDHDPKNIQRHPETVASRGEGGEIRRAAYPRVELVIINRFFEVLLFLQARKAIPIPGNCGLEF